MADIAKDYAIGETVWVAYPFPSPNYWTPQERTISKAEMLDSDNEALVYFTDGEPVQDGAVDTIYDTEALCAAAIIDDVIAKADATVNLDATTSVASTSGQPSLSLGRVDT